MKNSFQLHLCLSGLALGAAIAAATLRAGPLAEPMAFHDDFESGSLDAWQFPFPEDWAILPEATATGTNHFLHMKRSRDPGVPRRPLQFALIKNARVGSFDFQARVRREKKSMIVVFNYVDTLHFYYTHLSVDRGATVAVHNGIFKVNGEPRIRIGGLDASPALPDTAWHSVRVVRDVRSGAIEVFMDHAPQPLFSVVDRAFVCGQVGIGSFDETGDFDDVVLKSDDTDCAPGRVEAAAPPLWRMSSSALRPTSPVPARGTP